jgi:hypothetical protein
MSPQNIGVGATLAGGALNAAAIGDAAKTLQSGLKDAQGTIAGYAAPYVATGADANKQIAAGTQAGGQFNKTFTMADAQNSDAEKYARTTGVDALQNSALAKGGLLGTNSIVGIEDFAAKNAAQFQNQAFNQDQAQRTMTLGALENLSGTGSNVANAAGGNIAGLQSQAAQAGMNATLGEANQYNQAVSNAISAYKALAPTTTPSATNTPPSTTKAPTSVPNIPAGVSTNGTPAPAVVPNTNPTGNVTDANQSAAETARLAAQNGGNVTDANQTAAETARLQAQDATVAPAQQAAAQQAAQQAVASGTATPQQAAQVSQDLAKSIGTSLGQTPQQAAQQAQTNADTAAAAGVTPTGQAGTNVGDVNPATGGIIVPDAIMQVPIDITTGTPVLAADSFTSFFDMISGGPSAFDGSGPLADLGAVDPMAEFMNAPAFDFTAPAFDTTALGYDPAAFDFTAPAFDPAASVVTDYSTTPTFDMGSYDPTAIA